MTSSSSFVSLQRTPKKELSEAGSNCTLEKEFELPDGQIISVGLERFQCSEALFKPDLLGNEMPRIHATTYSSIRKDICSNVRDINSILPDRSWR